MTNPLKQGLKLVITRSIEKQDNSRNDESTKTRIETKRVPSIGAGMRVVMTNPLKQGLKQIRQYTKQH